MKPRISFSKEAAEHLYELALEHFQAQCPECEAIKKRLDLFLGFEVTRKIKRSLKKRPYCKDA